MYIKTNGFFKEKDLEKDSKEKSQKEMFITAITHDLKNSVQAQLLSLDVLNKESLGSLNSEQKEIIQMIIESVNYTKEMLYSVITTYMYDNGTVKLNKINFPIDDLVNNCINESGLFAKDKKISVVYNFPGLQIYADANQLRRVITNLINNAITYADKGSTLEIYVYKSKDDIVFEFTNTGKPIPKEIQKHIFDKYVTGSSGLSKTGFGIGLYSSKKVVEAHNGKISLNSKGAKTTFSFKIPAENKDNGLLNFV